LVFHQLTKKHNFRLACHLNPGGMTTKKAQPVALNPDTYADLLPALVDGDEGAFALLYDAYAPLLFGIIVRIVGDEKEAENLLQDTFVKIWNHISKYDAEKGRLARPAADARELGADPRG
jgi:hypothetical protein